MISGRFLSIFCVLFLGLAGIAGPRAAVAGQDGAPPPRPRHPRVVASAAVPVPRTRTRTQQRTPGDEDIILPRYKGPVTRVVVRKKSREMFLLNAKGRIVRRYDISLGWDPVGDKRREGDGRTPEGHYRIDARNVHSKYYKSLHISYPDRRDRRSARRRGVNPGGDIFIHGKPNGKSWMWWRYGKGRDWTNGCIAVTDSDISEMWKLVPDGTPIDIKP